MTPGMIRFVSWDQTGWLIAPAQDEELDAIALVGNPNQGLFNQPIANFQCVGIPRCLIAWFAKITAGS